MTSGAGETDPEMKQFSIGARRNCVSYFDDQGCFAANRRLRCRRYLVSAAWMKTTGTLEWRKLQEQYFPAPALYFAKFVQAYEAQGLSINYVQYRMSR